MKKLLLILMLSLVAITSHGQNRFSEKFTEADRVFNEIDWEEFKKTAAIAARSSAIKTNRELGIQQDSEAQFDTLTVRFTASKIYGKNAVIYTKHFAKHFEIPVTPKFNPFKTVLQEGKDYIMQITYNREIREEKHCSGCSGIVPAGLIWLTITPEQAKKDANTLKELTSDPETGYSRSPRYQ